MFNKFIEFISSITIESVIKTSAIVFLILVFNKCMYYKRVFGNKKHSTRLKADIKDVKKLIDKYSL